jgi:hypothetical protein
MKKLHRNTAAKTPPVCALRKSKASAKFDHSWSAAFMPLQGPIAISEIVTQVFPNDEAA